MGVDQKPREQVRPLGVRSRLVLPRVCRELRLHGVEGLPVDDGLVLAVVLFVSVGDLAGINRIRQDTVEMPDSPALPPVTGVHRAATSSMMKLSDIVAIAR